MSKKHGKKAKLKKKHKAKKVKKNLVFVGHKKIQPDYEESDSERS